MASLYLIEEDTVPVVTFVLTDRKIGFYRAEWFTDPKHRAGYLTHLAPTRPIGTGTTRSRAASAP
jgi:hypothetical protein